VKYQVLRGFCRGSGVNCEPGDVIEVEPKDAREWVHLGYVTEASDVPAVEPEVEVESEDDEHPERDADALANQTDKPTAREPKPPKARR